jgi:multiple sugar transport system permease protein
MKKPPLARLLKFAALTAVVVYGVFPAVWIALTAFKSEAELVRTPITWMPRDPTFSNFATAFSEQPLLRFLLNSSGIALCSTGLCVAVASAAAYAFARLEIRGRGFLLTALVGCAMCPPAALLTPLFEIMRGLGLLNTWAALILPNAVQSLPVATLVLVAFFQSIPRDLEAAAMIDGCSRVGTLLRIILPLSAPGLFTAAIIAFVNSWDEFLLALSLNAAPATRTLPVGIMLYQGEYTFPWPLIAAALVVAIVPLALLIVLFQERVVGGLTAGAVKG